ncbi:MAG TPA: CPXCG motif-containing cysteine-rich protein [Longimicrobiaceae bacterium]|nr:CPXCG motif-containing cysteine-rich protein [Longimicrobiaceae bacterium]
MIRINPDPPHSRSHDPLEEEFPLGDGTADTGATVLCPYCWEPCEVALDPGSGGVQEYVEDCPVCCRPWTVRVAYREDGSAAVEVEPADDV